MASENTGKIRIKRNRNPKPYERNQSFIGKLKAVLPQWISRAIPWSGGATNSTDAENDAQVAGPSSESQFKIPSSVPSTSGTSFSGFQAVPSTSNAEEPAARFSQIYHQPQNSNDVLVTAAEERLNEDDDDGDSISTSGCSSMVPHFDRQSEQQQEPLTLDDSALEKLKDRLQPEVKQTRNKSKNASQIQSSKKQRLEIETSIYSKDHTASSDSETSQSDVTISGSRRPSFNISAFGSPVFANKSRGSILTNDSIYYPGRTSFGGASSHRKIYPTAPYQINASRVQIKVRPKTNDDLGLVSSTAKKILQTLETMSTPLSDAQKIPQGSNNPSSILSFTPSHVRRRVTKTPSSDKKPNMLRGPPAIRILPPEKNVIPTINLESVSHQPKDESISKKDRVASQTNSIQSLDSTPVAVGGGGGGGGGKIKSRTRESLHYSSKQTSDVQEMPQLPELPNVSLNIKSLPKIDFGSSLSAKHHSTPLPAPVSKPSNFTFSSPLVKDGPIKCSVATTTIQSNFTFTAPQMVNLNNNDKVKDSGSPKVTFAVSNNSAFSTPVTLNLDNFKVPDTVVLKKKSPVKISGPPADAPSELKSGSLTDFLKQIKDDPAKPPLSALVQAGGKWECETCMISNECGVEECVACQTPKPSSSTSKSSNGFGAALKPPPGNWECDTCMVSNKSSDSKCVACQSPKPGSCSATTSTSTTAFSFGTQLKQSNTSKWECSTCMVHNDDASSKCVACTADKPPTNKSTLLMAPSSDKWECATCMIRNDADKDVCIACLTGRGGSVAKATTWVCDTCMIVNKNEVSKCIACETPHTSMSTSTGSFKFGASSNQFQFGATQSSDATSSSTIAPFKFGIAPSDNNNTTSAGIKFGATTNSKSPDSKSAESVPQFKFGASSSSEQTKTSDFKFGAVSENKPTESSTPFKFGISQASSEPSSFKFGESTKTESLSDKVTSKSSDSAVSASATGITFGADSSADKLPAANFAFGAPTSKPSAAPSGFVFGSASSGMSNVAASTDGFKFGNSMPKEISFGSAKDATAAADKTDGVNPATELPSVGFKVAPATDASSAGGFKLNNSALTSGDKADVKAPSSAFAFGVANSESSKNCADTSKTGFMFGASAPKPLAGGFTFGNSAVTSATSTPPASQAKLSFESSSQPFGSTSQTDGKSSTLTSSAATVPSTSQFSFSNSASKSSNGFSFNTPSSMSTSSALFTFGQNASATKPTESSAFGSATSSVPADTSKSMFSFGASAAKTSESSTGGFSFGASTNSASATPTVTTQSASFTFGSSASSNSTQPPPPYGSQLAQFGSSASSPAFASSTANTNRIFGNTTTTTTSSGTTPAVSAPSFQFGGPTSSASSTPSVFKFGANQAKNTTSGFSFGSQQSTTDTKPAAHAPTFTFGAQQSTTDAKPAAPASTFTFGAQQSTTDAKPAAPASTFTFGAQQSTTDAKPAAPASSFTFGAQKPNQAGAESKPAVPASFGFGMNASGSQSSTFGQSSSQINFGSTAPPAFGSAPTDTGSVFRFGASQPSQPAEPAVFGSPAAAAPASAVLAPSQPGGFSFNPSATPNANFATQPTQQFQFASGATDNPFSPAQAANQQGSVGYRKFKRAQRRMKK